MVQCAGLVQTDMGLNLNQRLCGLLMVWEVFENGLDDVGLMTQTMVVRLLGMRKSMRDQSCQIYMGLNLNQRLCDLLVVWKVVENGLDNVSFMT